MRGKVRILGKTLPVWAVGAAMILATAGAATGVVLAGQVTGTITTTASQALLVGTGTLTEVDAGLYTVSDDGTKFTAGAEINTGDDFVVNIPLLNESDDELTGVLTLVGPDGITLSVSEADDVTEDIVRTGPFTWKFRLPAGASNSTADMSIRVALADDMPPGFYSIDGTLKQVAQ